MSTSMGCNKEQMEGYMAALKAVVGGSVVKENLEVILRDAKRMHEEAQIQLTKDFVEQVEAFIKQEVEQNEKVFEDVQVTVNHIFEQAEATGAFVTQ